jgi:hypothetical protein
MFVSVIPLLDYLLKQEDLSFSGFLFFDRSSHFQDEFRQHAGNF